MVTVCVMSDTHGEHWQINVPKVDLLIHCGDFTNMGKPPEISSFNAWLDKLKTSGTFKKSIVIPGNHDFEFQKSFNFARSLLPAADYVVTNEPIEEFGLKIWGCSWVSAFYNWAFMADEEELAENQYQKIPRNLDVLICHGPPRGILDKTIRGVKAGSSAMADLLRDRQPKYYFCGHIHESRGIERLEKTTFVNAACLDKNNRPVHPFILEI